MNIKLDEKLRHLLDDDFGYLEEKDYEIINAEVNKALDLRKKAALQKESVRLSRL